MPIVHFDFLEKLENGRVHTDFGHALTSILSKIDLKTHVLVMGNILHQNVSVTKLIMDTDASTKMSVLQTKTAEFKGNVLS